MFGKLQGRFAVVGPSILSVYGCDATGYYGSEHLGQLDADNYRSVGMLLLKDKLIYSWQTLRTERQALSPQLARRASAAGPAVTARAPVCEADRLPGARPRRRAR